MAQLDQIAAYVADNIEKHLAAHDPKGLAQFQEHMQAIREEEGEVTHEEQVEFAGAGLHFLATAERKHEKQAKAADEKRARLDKLLAATPQGRAVLADRAKDDSPTPVPLEPLSPMREKMLKATPVGRAILKDREEAGR